MQKIKLTSFLSFLFIIFFSFIYTYETLADIWENEFLIIDMYSSYTEEMIDDNEIIETLIKLKENDASIILSGIHLAEFTFNIGFLILLSTFLFSFSKGDIYKQQNLNTLKWIVYIILLQTISLPLLEIWYVDIVNSLSHLDFEIRESFWGERIEGVVFTCILLIVMWIFLESINMKKRSDEYEMQKKFLVQQHKLSQLGQLLGFITHQWKDPLNRISSYIVSMQLSQNLDEKQAQKLEKCQQQVDYMNETMRNFKAFYKADSSKEYFYFDTAINYILELLKDDLLMNNIHVTFTNNNQSKIKGNENDFSQIILILINNSKEAFKDKEISQKEIHLNIDKNKIFYSDNAQGVDEKVLKNIFLPQISTKKEHMGIGLYIAKLILEEKFDASIVAKNDENGLQFTITLQKEETDV